MRYDFLLHFHVKHDPRPALQKNRLKIFQVSLKIDLETCEKSFIQFLQEFCNKN